MVFCEFCIVSKNTFFIEYFQRLLMFVIYFLTVTCSFSVAAVVGCIWMILWDLRIIFNASVPCKYFCNKKINNISIFFLCQKVEMFLNIFDWSLSKNEICQGRFKDMKLVQHQKKYWVENSRMFADFLLLLVQKVFFCKKNYLQYELLLIKLFAN